MCLSFETIAAQCSEHPKFEFRMHIRDPISFPNSDPSKEISTESPPIKCVACLCKHSTAQFL